MDTFDWRTKLTPGSRQRIVNKILDTLKKHLPFSGQEGLHEFKEIAERFEEKIYSAATSQSDYRRKISLKMLTMETKSQNTVPNSMPNNQVGSSNRPPDPGSLGMQSQVHNQGQPLGMPLPPNQSQTRQQLMPKSMQNPVGVQNLMLNAVGQNPNMQGVASNSQNSVVHGLDPSVASMDSTSQTGHPIGGDWQEEVFQKIKHMKDQYLPELSEMYHKIDNKLQQSQHDSLPQQPKSEQFEKLKLFKAMLERAITFLQVSKANIQPGVKEKLVRYEKQIINFINTNKPRKAVSQIQPGQLPTSHMHSMQQQQQQQPQSTSMDSTTPTGHPIAGDWQEEVFQKIKHMKEQYLPELSEIHHKIANKLLQHDSLPQQPKSEQYEKLKLYKAMLERAITFLQVSKANIQPGFKEKLVNYEKQIINFINAQKPRKAVLDFGDTNVINKCV